MARKPKLYVKFWRAKMSAVAKCTEGFDEDGNRIEDKEICGWQYPSQYSFFAPKDAEIRQEAKEHARLLPGHVIHVTVRDVASYWCEPESEIDEDMQPRNEAARQEAEALAPLPPNDTPTP